MWNSHTSRRQIKKGQSNLNISCILLFLKRQTSASYKRMQNWWNIVDHSRKCRSGPNEISATYREAASRAPTFTKTQLQCLRHRRTYSASSQNPLQRITILHRIKSNKLLSLGTKKNEIFTQEIYVLELFQNWNLILKMWYTQWSIVFPQKTHLH